MLSFTKKCVSLIHASPEYRDWATYVKEMLGYKTCALTNESSEQLTVDIHHHPLTIFDITNIILNTYIANQKSFTSLVIAKDVLHLHYNDRVGFIPLVSSLHEKYHNGFLVIPPKLIHGGWQYLLKTPGYQVSPDVVDKCNELMKAENNKFDAYLNWQNQGV